MFHFCFKIAVNVTKGQICNGATSKIHVTKSTISVKSYDIGNFRGSTFRDQHVQPLGSHFSQWKETKLK